MSVILYFLLHPVLLDELWLAKRVRVRRRGSRITDITDFTDATAVVVRGLCHVAMRPR